MKKYISKYPLLILSVVVLLMLLPNLNIPNLTIMEARNFITAKEMLEDGNWLLTTMNGEPRYQKPPLPTWLSAISASIFGIKTFFGLRLPAVLMILILGVFTFKFSEKLNLNRNHSFNNGLILITSFYVIGIINEAPWDIYAHGFMLVGLYYLLQFLELKSNNWKFLTISALCVALSIMSKGPVALYALFLPFILSYGIFYKFKSIKTKIVPLLIWIVLFTVIGGWWYLYVRYSDPNAFLKIATKETANWSSYNVKPFYYYWSFFTQSGIWTIPAFIGLLYPYIIKKTTYKKEYKFTFWWTILAVILLSVIPEKKSRYLMPVLIPLALNTGFYIEYLIKEFKNIKSKAETLPVYFNFGLFALIGLIAPIGLYFLLKDNFTSYLIPYLFTSTSLIIIGVIIIKNLRSKEMQNVFFATVLFMFFAFSFGFPISKSIENKDNYNSIHNLKQIQAKNNIEVYSIHEVTPELIWQYNGQIKNIYKNESLVLPSENKFGILVLNDDVPLLKKLVGENYTLNYVETYNLNVGKKIRERLIRQCYIVSKK
ncbi:glycosyltransferase family 39 protein [Lutibacter sp. TH_r2]|uniref:ArnT family glycosyltransferase n=1 Tax=Lutibacter sp. TH_r2 TaxID=3082083 RepID=UPI002954B60D|nr:glycosyltransferase family 39 protein [Lutibacter sp. TH_r2]MDV7188167.1 glycosyltransferase family 39 protein [Lutibacter sp. TH_r2]